MYVTADGVQLRLSAKGSEAGVTKNASSHTKIGSAGNDVLYSSSGDTDTGLGGDDSYNIWNVNNTIVEAPGGGVDTVFANYYGAYTLAANVENLVLKGGGASWSTGNSLNNIIAAGSATSFLDGGAGNDVLVGGTGRDTFNDRAGNGSDAIEKFDASMDQIRLQSYGITSYAALQGMISQVGADTVIQLPNTEKLVIRDTVATSLSASNFVLANSATQQTVGSVASIPGTLSHLANASDIATQKGWILLGNNYGVGAMVEGKDYTLGANYHAADLTDGTTFTWNFPTVATALYTAPAVLAFPEIMFGNSPKSGYPSNPGDTAHVFPVQVNAIADLTVKHDVSFSGDTRGFDVAYDLWFANSPTGGREAITNEVMLWVHQGNFSAFGDYLGTYTDGSFSATVYHNETQHLTSIVANSDTPVATIDLAHAIEYLESKGVVGGSEYLRGVELGAEVVSGSGSLTFNNLGIAMSTNNADGSTTTKTVTGTGTTVTHTDQISFVGTAGADTLTGNASDNIMSGGAGNDVIDGGAGNDRLDGGDGIDTASYDSATSRVHVNLSLQGVAQNTYGAGTDTLTNFENLTGSHFDDKLFGDTNANTISGGAGNDTIYAGSGDDTLIGGAGADSLYGGKGADHFVFTAVGDSTPAASDTIFDFSSAQGDKIDLRAIDANATLAGTQHFDFIGTASTHAAGDLQVSYGSGYGLLSGYIDGDQTADFVVRINGIDATHPLLSSDLILV